MYQEYILVHVLTQYEVAMIMRHFCSILSNDVTSCIFLHAYTRCLKFGVMITWVNTIVQNFVAIATSVN